LSEALRKTPLYDAHVRAGARMVEFGGYLMPVQYTSILAEHRAVRTAAGIFDVSHMGEFSFRGPGSAWLLQRLLTHDVDSLANGQVLYAAMCYEDGGTVDDCTLYRHDGEDYMLVVNAANIDKDFAWVVAQAKRLQAHAVEIANASTATGLIALQGPDSDALLQRLTPADLREIGYFHFRARLKVAGLDCLAARTGYTGEDGFELYCASEDTPALWDALVAAGAVPCGLGARDTLRLEAALNLYGHELTPEITPLEARMSPFVKLDKGEFIGRDALASGPPKRRQIGLLLDDRRNIPRPGMTVLRDGEVVGTVTSGTFSPTLEAPIALVLCRADAARSGADFTVDIRGRPAAARSVKLPFYRRPPKGGAAPVS
jgi:aminomethyltransferase